MPKTLFYTVYEILIIFHLSGCIPICPWAVMSATQKNDAACRVIARLVRERDEARSQMHSQRIALAQAQQTAAPAAAAAIEGEAPMMAFYGPSRYHRKYYKQYISQSIYYFVCIHCVPGACFVFHFIPLRVRVRLAWCAVVLKSQTKIRANIAEWCILLLVQ